MLPSVGSRGIGLAVSVLALAALTSCGGGGGSGADSTAPTVSVMQPGLALSRVVTLAVVASDNRGVTEVRLLVDDLLVGTDTSAPFEFEVDTSTLGDGDHTIEAQAVDAAGNMATSTAITVAVDNSPTFTLALSGGEEQPSRETPGSASGSFTVDLATGAVTGSITVAGFTATAAHIHDGFAGVNGPILIGLEVDAGDANRWNAPAGAMLNEAQLDSLLAGGLYVNAHSATFPGGEVRAQILPAGISVIFTDLRGLEEVPDVTTNATGRGAVTLQEPTRTAVINVNVTDLASPTAAHLHRAVAGTSGDIEVPLTQDTSLATRWFANATILSQELFDALRAGRTYLNVHTIAHQSGEIRGQVTPPGVLVAVTRMNGEQEVPAPHITAAKGVAAVTVDTASGATEIHVNATGVDDAMAAHLHDGFAGENGDILVTLEQDPATDGHWRSNGATLTAEQVNVLREGGLYTNVHTPAATDGLIRGQALPADVELVVSHLNGAQQEPGVTTDATGRAFTTVAVAAKKLSIHVQTTDAGDVTSVHVGHGARGEAGDTVFPLATDAADAAHWFAESLALTDEQLADYRAGLWYVDVATSAHPDGAIRGQIELGGVVPFQFEEIQVQVLNASCATSGCHAGSAAPLGLNLESGQSFDNLVNHASGGVPSFLLVAPGDAGASYLIRKLEDGPGIVGDRMPPGGDPLSGDTINRIRAWINAGALPSAAAAGGDTEAPVVTLGDVAATVTGTVTLTATATDDTGVTLVRWRVNGTVVGSDTNEPYSLGWDTTTVANGAVTIDAQALDAAGNVGTSTTTATTVSNAAVVTLAQIQASVFTPSCSFCHTGPTGSTLPSGLNLSSAAASYQALVNVNSLEVPTLKRVAPNDPAMSYLIQKLEGTATVGERMPLGGQALDQVTIDQIKSWIESGAPPPPGPAPDPGPGY